MSTQAKKQRLAEQREHEKCVVHDYCEANGIEMEFVNDFQIRLNGVLDIYPTAKKFCFLPRKTWGMYTRIEDLCNKHIHAN